MLGQRSLVGVKLCGIDLDFRFLHIEPLHIGRDSGAGNGRGQHGDAHQKKLRDVHAGLRGWG
jgi:hypothetical protein